MDNNRKSMTSKRAIFIVIFAPIFISLIDYGYIKANMVGTFSLKASIVKSIVILILVFVVDFIWVKINKKYAKI